MQKILIVEDEAAYLKVLHDQLSVSGYEVIDAVDGKKGLEAAISKHPDLILLDIRLPVMDGMEMLNLLRKGPAGKNVKVIILTNVEPDVKILDSIVRDQLTYYFIKSDTKIEDLFKKIKELLAE